MLMFRSMPVVCVYAPGSLDKKQGEEGKKDSGNLMPQHARGMCQALPKGLPGAFAMANNGGCSCNGFLHARWLGCGARWLLCLRWFAGRMGMGVGLLLQPLDRCPCCPAQFLAQSDIAHDRKV